MYQVTFTFCSLHRYFFFVDCTFLRNQIPESILRSPKHNQFKHLVIFIFDYLIFDNYFCNFVLLLHCILFCTVVLVLCSVFTLFFFVKVVLI